MSGTPNHPRVEPFDFIHIVKEKGTVISVKLQHGFAFHAVVITVFHVPIFEIFFALGGISMGVDIKNFAFKTVLGEITLKKGRGKRRTTDSPKRQLQKNYIDFMIVL